tara:strand:- start:3685 stop:3969 length:285 start_codon:yes stop_codon:yes gene_type:complete
MSSFLGGIGVGLVMASAVLFLARPAPVIDIPKVGDGGAQLVEFSYSKYKPLPKLNLLERDKRDYIHSSVRRVEMDDGSSGVRIVVLFKTDSFYI